MCSATRPARFAGESVARAAHEVRNTVLSVLGHLEAALDDGVPVPPRHREHLVVARRNAERLGRLAEDLLSARDDAERRPDLRFTDVDLATVVVESAEAAEPHARKVGIALAVRVVTRPVVRGDRERLAQVVDNLISNALKFTPRAGWVSMSVGERGDQAEVKVRDTGIGIDPDHLPRLFEPAFRGPAVRGPEGHGLGLTIARMIVEAHGGRIWAENAPGSGSTFVVTLPRAPAVSERSVWADA